MATRQVLRGVKWPCRHKLQVPIAIFGVIVASACWTPASAQTAASAFTSGYRFDAMRRLVGELAAPQNAAAPGAGPYLAKRYTYDADGRLVRTEKGTLSSWQAEVTAQGAPLLPANWGAAFTALEIIDIAYDAIGNVLQQKLTTSAGGAAVQAVTQASYDEDDQPYCVATRMNMAAIPTLPAAGTYSKTFACTLGTIGSFGPDRITKNIYDSAGQVLQIRQAVGSSIERAYATYNYTPNGKREYVIDANGNRNKLIYDGYDRQIGWYLPASTLPSAFNSATPATALATAGSFNASDYEQYSYDANGNRTQLRKRDGQLINYTYDALNRMLTKDVPGTAADVTYTYDLLGHQLTAKFTSGGQGITNVYDGVGRLVNSTNTTLGTSRQLQYQYDANGNRTRVIFPDAANYFTYEYDGLDRMTAIKELGATTLAAFGYDNLGRRAQLTRGGGVSSSVYGYDAASRLANLSQNLAATTNDLALSFSYSPASQMVSRTISNDAYAWTAHYNVNRAYAKNGLNQYTTAGPASPTYAPNGNLTFDGSTTFGYDTEDRLVSATGQKIASLVYDPRGRLVKTSGGSAGTTQFLYDGDALVAEYDGSGNLLRRYVHGPSVDEPLVWYEGSAVSSATRRYLHANHQGSIIAASDSSGALIQINSYDPYGIPGAANLGRFQYTGQIMIPELGLYHYKARAYSPTLGRFLQTDPVGYDDDFNLYAYVGNDPLNRVDPTGTYGRGDGFTDDQWKRFDAVQRKAADQMEARAEKLEKKAAKLKAKGKTELAASARTGAANLRAGVTDLRGTEKLAVGLSTAEYVAMGNGQTGPGGAAASSPNGQTMWVNLGNAKAWGSGGSTMMAWVVGHESLHSGAGLMDRATNGVLSYGLTADPAQKKTFESLRGTPEGMIRPDNLMDLAFPGFADQYKP